MNLLNKSMLYYLFYAAITLLITIPILYFSIQRIVAEDVDEGLLNEKIKIINRLINSPDSSYPVNLQTAFSDVTLTASSDASNKKDRFFTVTQYNAIDKENTPFRILESPIILHGKTYIIQLKNSLLDSEDLIISIVSIVGALLLTIVIGLILITRRLSKKLWRPFYNTIAELSLFKIESDDILHFGKTNINEFATLNKAITELTSRNKKVFQSQKEFTENASHELQTPLAVLQGKIELLMQTSPLTKEQSELIGNLENANNHLKRLNKGLLLLAKIENNQFAETEKVHLNGIVDKLLDQYSLQIARRKITIQKKFNQEIVLTGNRMLLEIMIGNILSNSIRHNLTNGIVSIEADSNELCFLNSGDAKQLDHNKIFERFYKQTNNNTSVGLGLQIAKKIAENYGMFISYDFVNKKHLFKVHFHQAIAG